MASKLMTVREVAAIKTDGRYSTGGGLYLEIVGNARRWFTRYTVDGTRREMQIGSAIDIGLKDARDRVTEIRRSVREGNDPIKAKASDRIESSGIPTFGTFADELIKSLAVGFKNAKHRYQWEQTLGDSYCASVRSKTVDAITTEDVLEILKPHWAEKQETASRLRGRIEKVLDAAKARGFRSGENPARWRGHLDHLLSRRQKLQRGHQPAMAYEEVPAFIKRLQARDAVASLALEFTILTAARAGEVYGATWSEIDQRAKLWTVPANRMKAGKVHRVPLSERSLAILEKVEDLRTAANGSGFVFPGGKRGRSLSNMAFKQLLTRMGESGFVPHGFRSSFRDWCGECTAFPREVAEAALAHTVGNSVELAYRRGDALEKRRGLMDAWSVYTQSRI